MLLSLVQKQVNKKQICRFWPSPFCCHIHFLFKYSTFPCNRKTVFPIGQMDYDLLPENKYAIKSTLNFYFIMCYLCSICNRLYAVILGLLYPTLWGSDKRWIPFPLKSYKAWSIIVFIPIFLNWQVSPYPNYALPKRKNNI